MKSWQRNHGLTADGIAGPQTRAKLGMSAGPVLKRGGKARASGVSATRSVASRGGGVQALQRAIGTGADGVFGPRPRPRASAGRVPMGSRPTASPAR